MRDTAPTHEPHAFDFDEAESFFLEWIESIADDDVDGHLELKRFLGIFEFTAEALDNISSQRRDIQSLISIFNQIRSRVLNGRSASDFNWSTFQSESTSEDQSLYAELLESDADGFLATTAFLNENPSNADATAPDPSHDRSSDPDASTERYDEWNEIIFDHFFTAFAGGRPVYLALDDPTVDELGSSFGLDGTASRNLVSSVHYMLDFDSPAIFGPIFNRLYQWHSDDSDTPPPHLALLGVFVLAASRMQSDESHWQTNYYFRLGQTLSLDEIQLERFKSQYMRHSENLWAELGNWLRHTGGQHGLPTARAFDHRRYVGLAMSQILLRRAERDRLPEFFDWAGYQPGGHVAPIDLEFALDKWIERGGFTDSFSDRWSTMPPDFRLGIAEICELELQGWDGSQRTELGHGQADQISLRLACQLNAPPFRDLTFAAVVRNRGLESDHGMYTSIDENPDGSSPEVTVSESSFVLNHLDAKLTAGSALDLLSTDIQLTNSDAVTINRVQSPVVVFDFDEMSGLWIETSRVSLGKPALALVHDGVRADVNEILSESARPGFSFLNGIQGCPSGWSLVENLEVIGVGDARNDENLERLIPASSASISPKGFLRLLDDTIWLAKPECSITAIAQGTSATTLHIENGDRSEGVEIEFEGVAEIDLSDLAIDGELKASVTERNGNRSRTLIERIFPLTSPSHPPESSGLLSYKLGTNSPSGLSATDNERMDGSWLTGFSCVGAKESVTPETGDMPSDPVNMTSLTEPADPASVLHRVDSTSGSASESPRHVHHLIVEERGPGSTRKYFNEKCKICGAESVGFGSVNADRRRKKIRGSKDLSYVKGVKTATPIDDDESGGGELLLDALSLTGSGTGAQLFSLIRRSGARNGKYTLETAMDLSALGILDIQWDDSFSNIEYWSLVPSQLVQIPDSDDAFLAGFRSRQLVGVLSEIFADNIRITNDNGDYLPPRIVVSASKSDLSRATRELSESVGYEVALESPSSSKILTALPNIIEISNGLPVTEAVTESGIKPVAGYSEPSSTIGVFRDALAFNNSTYLRDEAGKYRACNYRVAKWAHDGLIGAPRIWYNQSSKEVIAPLGAPQFSTYERVLVSQSGLLPTKMSDNTIRYSNVGSNVASGLWKLLGGKG